VTAPSRLRIFALAFAASSVHAAGADPSLVGCWRSVHIVQYVGDAPNVEDRSGRCTLQFEPDHFESRCASSSGTAVTTYRYEIVRPNFYSATMTGSTFRTSLIGSTREYEYHVDGDRLRIVTKPTPGTRMESESQKVACG
jgi:hypothetical protein